MDPRFHGLDHLDGLVLSGQGKVWIGEAAAIVAEVEFYPGGAKVLHGLVAAGALQEIVESLIPRAEAWGKSVGCTHAIIESREGWARVLKSHGYEPHQVAVRKEL
jgi:hypothetical protein